VALYQYNTFDKGRGERYSFRSDEVSRVRAALKGQRQPGNAGEHEPDRVAGDIYV
jgi:hypothetical protein